MALSSLLFFVAVLACPIGMGVMMWLMNRNMGGQPQGSSLPSHTAAPARLDALREQRRQIEAEIAEAEKITALETQKQAIVSGLPKTE